MRPRRPRRLPHPYFVVYLAALAIGAVFAAKASAAHPAWALQSSVIYRGEVGFGVGAIVYVVLTAGWLAAQGRYLPQRLLGGGDSSGAPQPVDAGAAPVDGAASDFNDFRKTVDIRITSIENALGNVINRTEALERSGPRAAEVAHGNRFTGKLRWLRGRNRAEDEGRER